ncbi:glycosyltransferase [Pedobacter foliorum]|uniref:glycosyltransferase n=1 Tax=Pedobacter foliorum TaxID=2739058 RepID=UPI001567038F|nr:glycosyltransferase [Pedobacter foliorum]NRF38638.1 glycosyltransferase family 2 protein [Pedobacter foliorum]
MKKGITVIICTYNGAPRLSETLNHLAAQVVPKNLNWEILLVDNASTDGTSVLATEIWEKHNVKNVPLNIAYESTPGKLFAFQKGITLANYEYFIICDDDNWLSQDYVNIAFNILDKNPRIGAAGGQAIAVAEDGANFPEWFEAAKEGYAVGEQAKNTGSITYRASLWGAGLASRTQLYLDTYKTFPSLLIDKNNQRILTAEDTEYCLRIVLKGYQLYYDSNLSLKHYITSGRLTLNYKNSLYDNFSNANSIMDDYYLALKFGPNGTLSLFNRVRLTLITPIRYIFSSSTKKTRQRKILSYLLPSIISPDSITSKIKKLMSG